MDILKPGTEAAGIQSEVIVYDEDLTIAPAPGLSPEPESPAVIDVEPLRTGLTELPVTALSVFAACPERFRWEFIEQHPGVHDGAGSAMRVGTLTHLALEHEITSAEGLRAFDAGASDEEIERAISLAHAFNKDEYGSVNRTGAKRELRFAERFGSFTLTGTADLVGEDFVLDYKTDATVEPHSHRFQLWAYAKALGKSRALIAYLAHDRLHEFTTENLAGVETEASILLDRIASGDHRAAPSLEACRICAYKKVCEFRFDGSADDADA